MCFHSVWFTAFIWSPWSLPVNNLYPSSDYRNSKPPLRLVKVRTRPWPKRYSWFDTYHELIGSLLLLVLGRSVPFWLYEKPNASLASVGVGWSHSLKCWLWWLCQQARWSLKYARLLFTLCHLALSDIFDWEKKGLPILGRVQPLADSSLFAFPLHSLNYKLFKRTASTAMYVYFTYCLLIFWPYALDYVPYGLLM